MEIFTNFTKQEENKTVDSEASALSLSFYHKMDQRRSIRSFSSEAVNKEILINAIRTAGTSPSGANRQPWHFSLITSQKIKSALRQAAEKVESDFYNTKASQEWLDDLKPLRTNSIKEYLTEAPALIVVSTRTHVKEGDDLKRTYYPIESTGIATGILITALHNAGLGTLTHTPKPMYFINQVLELDSTYKPFMIVVAGYPKQPVFLPTIKRKHINDILREY